MFKFLTKAPMEDGCPIGTECVICDSKGTHCGSKSVVYIAKCDLCEEELTKIRDARDIIEPELLEYFSQGTYVGETSRTWRCRIREHEKKLFDMKPDSFIVEHWAQTHGTQAMPPTFSYSIVSQHSDALSRQIKEALLIKEQGKLNKKLEYSSNELIRTESYKYSWEEERDRQREVRDRNQRNSDTKAFIDVISNVMFNSAASGVTNCLHSSRYIPAQKRTVATIADRRMRPRMETSTPVRLSGHYRDARDIVQETTDSSIEDVDGGDGTMSSLGGQNTLNAPETNVSGDLCQMKIKPSAAETKTQELAKLTIAGLEYYESLEFRNKMKGKRTRTISSPDSTQALRDMMECIRLVDRGRKHSNDQSDLNAPLDLSDDPKFKRYHSDSSLEDYTSLMDNGKCTHSPTGLEKFIKKCVNESIIKPVNKEPSEVFDWEDLNLSELFCEVIQSVCDDGGVNYEIFDGEDWNLRELFQEDEIDYIELQRLVEEGRRNKLYGIYKKLNEKELAHNNDNIFWDKRKMSPEQHLPSKFTKMVENGVAVKTLSHSVSDVRDRAATIALTPVSKQIKHPIKRVLTVGRRRCNSVGGKIDWSKQKKITDMLKMKADMIPRKLDMEQQDCGEDAE